MQGVKWPLADAIFCSSLSDLARYETIAERIIRTSQIERLVVPTCMLECEVCEGDLAGRRQAIGASAGAVEICGALLPPAPPTYLLGLQTRYRQNGRSYSSLEAGSQDW